MKTPQRIWIVGGSSGIGLELVKIWAEQGHSVITSSRHASSTPSLLSLQKEFPQTLHTIDIDVTHMDSIEKAVNAAWKCLDGLDFWFYNAGAYSVMPASEWKVEAFEQMNEVNYLGAVRIMQGLYPLFKKAGRGRWVWNASLSSYFGLPLGGGYSAPKAALVNLAESLQPELMADGIELQIIDHGFVRTRLTAKNSFKMPQLMEPYEAAEQIAEGIEKPYRFEIRFPFALALFLRLLRSLPYSWSLAITRKSLP